MKAVGGVFRPDSPWSDGIPISHGWMDLVEDRARGRALAAPTLEDEAGSRRTRLEWSSSFLNHVPSYRVKATGGEGAESGWSNIVQGREVGGIGSSIRRPASPHDTGRTAPLAQRATASYRQFS